MDLTNGNKILIYISIRVSDNIRLINMNSIEDSVDCPVLTVFGQRLEGDVGVGGAKGVAYKSPPPPQVVLPVVQTPEVMQLATWTNKQTNTQTHIQTNKQTATH